MRASRAEAGCLDYVFAADPIDDGRVILFESWESEEALAAHIAAIGAARASAPPPAADAPAAAQGAVVDHHQAHGVGQRAAALTLKP